MKIKDKIYDKQLSVFLQLGEFEKSKESLYKEMCFYSEKYNSSFIFKKNPLKPIIFI